MKNMVAKYDLAKGIFCFPLKRLLQERPEITHPNPTAIALAEKSPELALARRPNSGQLTLSGKVSRKVGSYLCGQIGVVSMHYSFEVIMPDNILRSMAGGGSIA
jgi:hypothetical protein